MRLLSSIIVLLAVCCVVSSAEAQESTKEFQDLVKQGVDAFQAEQWDEAVAKFKQARTLYDEPTLTYNIGRAYQLSDRCASAKAAFETYAGRSDIDDAARARAAEQIAALGECRTLARLTVVCTPADLTLTVDGTVRECPYSADVDVGTHQYQAAKRGHETVRESFDVPTGGAKIDVNLVKEAPAGKQAGLNPLRLGSYVAFGVSGVTLLSGLYIESRGPARVKELEDLQNQPGSSSQKDAAVADLVERGKRARNATRALLITSVLTGATGVVLFVVSRDGPEVAVSPTGVQLTQRF